MVKTRQVRKSQLLPSTQRTPRLHSPME
jgi:hypothetical protein